MPCQSNILPLTLQHCGLHEAARKGDVETVKAAITGGITPAAVNSFGEDGETALHWTALCSDPEKLPNYYTIAEMLIGARADVNQLNAWGEAPLHHVTQQNDKSCFYHADIKMAKILIRAGADRDIPNSDGDTPLRLAVYFGKYRLAKFLIRTHALLDKPNHDGYTLMSGAGTMRVRKLLENALTKCI